MSGIFKSIKKVFKKVGKVIKKIAPYLIIAAGVYFGGSYLMSTYGGATSAAAGSAATSFTKSAGVWKSFLGGLTNGTAAQSAAAFAEGSYQASIGAGALSLSGQVAAGTAAVNSLNGVLSTQEAVAAGVDFAKGAWTQAGGDPQSGWNIIFKGLNQSQAINAGQLGVDAAGSSAITTLDSSTMAQIEKDMAWGGDISQRALAKGGAVEQAATDVSSPTTMLSGRYAEDAGTLPVGDVFQGEGEVPGAQNAIAKAGIIADGSGSSTQLPAGGDRSLMQMIYDRDVANAAERSQYNSDMLTFMREQAADRKAANKNQLLWSIAQTGLKAVGGYMTAKSEEEYRDRPRNWKRKEDEPMWDPWSGEKRKGIIV